MRGEHYLGRNMRRGEEHRTEQGSRKETFVVLVHRKGENNAQDIDARSHRESSVSMRGRAWECKHKGTYQHTYQHTETKTEK